MAGGESTTARNKRQALQLPGQGQSSASFLSTRPRKHVKKGQKQSPLRRSPRLRRLKEINDTLPAPSHAPLPSPSPVSDDEHVSLPTLLGVLERLSLVAGTAVSHPPTIEASQPETRKRTRRATLSEATTNILSSTICSTR